MKYLISLETPTEISSGLTAKPEEMLKTMKEMFAQMKPEASYFSTTRRFSVLVVNVEDPHVELRRIFESLSKYGKVTVDPVSTLDEFLRFWQSSLR
ncbi:MAG TPA: hypothetical protein VJ574_00985 [Candidatus Bathyarchaeia archaeon]|nr:MAG: hypothetical protein A3K70_01790 [Candidatus Bathyarchaeota archaeon RBG_16_48_13]HJX22970.1 hypothetical protein [Candidatus Bathyarchaeia archaeon]